ncbi:MAG: Pycsar system effector family protein [Candidatus Cyclobacteriaceae bacterium M3_2C_046]
MKDTKSILDKTEHFVRQFFLEFHNNDLPYHNLQHTIDVVKAAQLIGHKCKLSEKELVIVSLAAWCHDIGYYRGCVEHEKESIEIAVDFFRKNQVPDQEIQEIINCINATKIPQQPSNLVQKVICDADLFHLSAPDYLEKSNLLRKEMSRSVDKKIKQLKWLKTSLKFMENHHYFTLYGQEQLAPAKQENYIKLKNTIEALESQKNSKAQKTGKLEEKLEKLKDKYNQIKTGRPDRGIETMFRITSRNHLDLSAIADNKANIMISVNAIILSILLSVLFRRFDDYPNLIIPAVMLTLVCLLTVIFSILATRPNVTAGIFTKEDITERRTNLLFFGNFHRMELQDFEWGVKEMMSDRDFLYSSIIRDLYFLGKVLGRKYKFLRIAYNIFMFGLVISVLAFAIALIFFPLNQY